MKIVKVAFLVITFLTALVMTLGIISVIITNDTHVVAEHDKSET
jgi:hypothetical protein